MVQGSSGESEHTVEPGSSDIVAKAIADLNEEVAQLSQSIKSNPEAAAFAENSQRYDEARRAAFEAAAPIARELSAFVERHRGGYPANSPESLQFQALCRARQRAMEMTFEKHGFNLPKDELPVETSNTSGGATCGVGLELGPLSADVALSTPLPPAALQFLEFLYDRGFNPILPEEVPTQFGHPDVRLPCEFQGLICIASDGIQISRKGRALVAEGRARRSESARRPTEHAGLPRTLEVKRVIDGILQMQHACRLIELDRIDFQGREDATGVSPAFAASMADVHYSELRAALERTRGDLPRAAWALGSTDDEPVGDYRLVLEALNLLETQLNTAMPSKPVRAAPGKWLSLGESLDPIRFRLQTMALRTSDPPERTSEAQVAAPAAIQLTAPEATSMESAPPPRSPAAPGPCFIKDGERWKIRFDGVEGSFDDGQPMRVLREILSRPHPQEALTAASILREPEPSQIADPLMDDDYRAQTEARARDLVESIAEARNAGDMEEVTRHTHELQEIRAKLRQASGLGGRDRQSGPDPAASQVKRVARALSTAISRLRTADPAMTCLADHCHKFINRNSHRWAYRPPSPEPQWEL